MSDFSVCEGPPSPCPHSPYGSSISTQTSPCGRSWIWLRFPDSAPHLPFRPGLGCQQMPLRGERAPSPGCLHSVLIPALVVHTFARVFYNFTKLLSVVSYSQSGSELYLSVPGLLPVSWWRRDFVCPSFMSFLCQGPWLIFLWP